jgi:integrase
MALRIKNGRFHYRFQLDGIIYTESTGLEATGPNAKKNRKLAEEMERTHLVQIVQGQRGIRKMEARTFSDASAEFMDSTDTTCKAENTARRIRTSMASLREFFGRTIVSLITPGEVDRYKLWRLRDHGCQPVTVRNDLGTLSLFFKWAVLHNYARENVVLAVERPSAKDAKREHIVTEAEEKLYFAAATKHKTTKLHDVGRLMLLQGCRPEELETLRWDAVNLIEGKITVTKSKTEAGLRTLQLTDESRSILARRLGEAKGGEYVFPGDAPGSHSAGLNHQHDRVIDDLNPCMKCGKPERKHKVGRVKKPVVDHEYTSPTRRIEFVMYDFRHTFATRAIRAGMSITDLGKILGHTSIKITERYVHLAQEDMDRAMQQYNAVLVEKERREKGAIQ